MFIIVKQDIWYTYTADQDVDQYSIEWINQIRNLNLRQQKLNRNYEFLVDYGPKELTKLLSDTCIYIFPLLILC